MGLLFASWWEDLVFLLVSLLAFGLYKVHMVGKFFEGTNIKYVPVWVTLWLDLKVITLRVSLFNYLESVYNHFPSEKAIGYVSFFRPVLMVRDPGLAEKVLVKDFSSFHDHGVQFDTDVNPLDGNLFNLTGAKWRALRARLSPVFSSGRLKSMFPQVDAIGDRLACALPRGTDFLVRDYLSRFAIDVIASTAFGMEAGALEDPDCEFRRMASRIFRPRKSQMVKGVVRALAPGLFKKLRLKAFDDEVNRFFFSVTKQAFEHRASSGASRGDFVDLLLQLKGRGSIGIEEGDKSKDESKAELDEACQLIMTDELLTAQSFIFLAAGWESTTSVMTYALYYLSKNQDVQSRLRAEIRSYETLDYESVKAMAYLDSCISETMRLFPGTVLIRLCTKDYVVVDDDRGPVGKVGRGTTIIVPVQSIHKDPRYYPGPELFDPDRFSSGAEKASKRPSTFMPFGEGPRVCIAQRFALMEVRVAIAKLVSKFRITLSPKTIEPITIDPKNFVSDIVGGLWVNLEEIEETA